MVYNAYLGVYLGYLYVIWNILRLFGIMMCVMKCTKTYTIIKIFEESIFKTPRSILKKVSNFKILVLLEIWNILNKSVIFCLYIWIYRIFVVFLHWILKK